MSEPPGERATAVSSIINAVRSLTLTNVLVIALLILALGPAYVAWKIINDEELLTIFLSSYEEHPLVGTDCSMRIASVRGGAKTFYLSLTYAYVGSDRWYLGVNTPLEPTAESAHTYCNTLAGILLHIQGRGPNPTFPNSNRTVFPLPGLVDPKEEKQ